MQYPQLLPKEIRTELDLYRYYRLSFLVHPDDVGQPTVTLANLTIRGFTELALPPIEATWRQLEEFVEGGNRLGNTNPMNRNDVSIYLDRAGGEPTKLRLWHRLVGVTYYPILTFSPEAEELLIEKLTVLLKDYHDFTSELHTGSESIIY